ncbi:MAG TPA: YggS family pyridoxal phosphate-dependent enzyme [Bacteriovoracaceae bacterium]|nr:YggS family pyridoxal phosphate-dependent enzyme [Bacteriovoracaceae bacterium]
MKNKFSEHYKKVLQDFGPNQNLLIVSKTRTIEEIKAYYDLGHRHFGENRVQELLLKSSQLKNSCPDIRWHMIGHLQSNKIKDLYKIESLYAIHSVDSLGLLEQLIKYEDRLSSEVGVFLQFNTSREDEKSGFEDIEELKISMELLKNSKKLKLQGLMTMGALRVEDQMSSARRCFEELAQIKTELDPKLELSMGMSQDYHIALECGSNWLRLGTMMFEIESL